MIHPKYRPDIDGLRALAVLSVLVFHFFPYWLPGGFIGVDIFFVISGYLITGIILGSLDKGEFSFRGFYERRVRRIAPALLVVLFSASAAGWYLLLSDEFSEFGKQVAAAASFLANIAFWQEAGYFDSASETKPLLHLWSLGIEEQFYILWPLIVWALAKRGRNFMPSAIAITVISFAINIFMVRDFTAGDFYSPFSRFWELGIGAILACLARERPRLTISWPTPTSLAGFAMIAAGLVLIKSDSKFPGWWALLPTVGAALIVAAGPQSLANAKLLANRPARFIGQISYPLYLWHWPLFAFSYIVVNDMPGRNIRFALFALSFPLAWLTYKIVEPKFRFKHDRRTLWTLVAGSALALALGAAIWSGIVPPRSNDEKLGPIVRAIGDWGFPPKGWVQKPSKRLIWLFEKGDGKHATLFFGDSHIAHLGPGIDEVLNKGGNLNRAILLSRGNCSPFDTGLAQPQCEPARRLFQQLASSPDVDTVVVGAYWQLYVGDKDTDFAKFSANLTAFLRSLALHKRVFIISDNPGGQPFDPKSSLEGSRLTALSHREIAHYVHWDKKFGQIRNLVIDDAHRANVNVLDASTLMCRAEACITATDNGTPIYMDTDHMRPFFVRAHSVFLTPTLKPVALPAK